MCMKCALFWRFPTLLLIHITFKLLTKEFILLLLFSKTMMMKNMLRYLNLKNLKITKHQKTK